VLPVRHPAGISFGDKEVFYPYSVVFLIERAIDPEFDIRRTFSSQKILKTMYEGTGVYRM